MGEVEIMTKENPLKKCAHTVGFCNKCDNENPSKNCEHEGKMTCSKCNVDFALLLLTRSPSVYITHEQNSFLELIRRAHKEICYNCNGTDTRPCKTLISLNSLAVNCVDFSSKKAKSQLLDELEEFIKENATDTVWITDSMTVIDWIDSQREKLKL